MTFQECNFQTSIAGDTQIEETENLQWLEYIVFMD